MNVLEALRAARPGLTWDEVAPRALPPLPPPGTPLGPLRRALRKARRPVIVVNDSARVLPRDLPELLGELWELAGARASLLVATGTHRDDPARARDRLGGLPAQLHDCDDEAAHAELGRWRFDRRVLEADLVLAIGSVEPHYFGGWAGAHKTATVGVWARATTAANHEHALDPGAQPTALDGNPVFADLAAAADALAGQRRLLVLNQVLDARGTPVGVGLGTWRGSLERCLTSARARFVHQVPEPVQVVVAQVEGPLGRSLYQADKGVKNHEAALADGGTLVLCASFEEGLGSPRFVELLRRAPDVEAARRVVREEGYTLGDHKAVRWRALEARGVTVQIVAPGLDLAALAGSGLQVHRELEDALAACPEQGRGLLVRDAGVMASALAPPS